MLESVCSIVRCVSFMRRIFSSAITALAAGACLRFFFVLKYPASSGDTILYEQIATNWLKHHVYAMNVGGAITPVDIRVPGYPAFLAVIYWLSGKTGPDARFWVMTAQVVVDLLTCVVAPAWRRRCWLWRCGKVRRWRVFLVALWLTALCPFTANYVAVPLTETLATFFTTLTILFLCLLLLRRRTPIFWVRGSNHPFVFQGRSGSRRLQEFPPALGTLYQAGNTLVAYDLVRGAGLVFPSGRQWSLKQ